ncbi:DDE-type integrase/transposase/recombinase [Aminipila luticellarii]|uniref:Transposase n=1 Tax=Aminipila luticellarii TaxID=2507160 RepID=A0A410PW51_9FIRM|nr:DDE-type integrase/transposase/recombinase [Aminipila luticellarii]QAT42786.1 transposase [Aminipila luticellarii]QAT43145.1 transposase [Aminipila luticellarii]
MASITQDMKYRLSLIKYAQRFGVTKAAIRYHHNRQYIYRWLRRYDGSIESLRELSRKPHSHKNQHTANELKLIHDMRRRNPNAGLVVFWVKLRQRGYSRSITGLYRVLIKQSLIPKKPQNPKYIAKKYEQMEYPGQRVQIDVKFVPSSCLVGEASDKKFYQYTAIDEFSRFRYLAAFEEHSSYSASEFLKQVVKAFPFKIECVQTDNGQEFTKRLGTSKNPTLTLFQRTLKEQGIIHKMIRPYTPRHNGKVERSHRKDNEYFYAIAKFYSFNDFKLQLKKHNANYNNFPMRPLGWVSPRETLFNFLKHGVTYV